MDGVQIHAAHDYLLCEFLTLSYNKRIDEFGGSDEKRSLIIKRILSGIKNKCGDDYPVFIKLNANVREQNDSYGEDIKNLLPELKKIGIEAVEFSGCDFRQKSLSDHNYYLERSMYLKGDTDIPVMLVGGIRNLNDMENALASGIDMVSLSRPLICEPNLITKLKQGQDNAKCISCNRCYLAGEKRCVLR